MTALAVAQQNGTTALPAGRVACSPKEFAQAKGVCIATVTNWIRDGRIKSYKIGARRFIPMSEVLRSGEAE
ncbi:DNA-binding protein, excisionase family [Sphingomonas paucimobilis]|nr:DNA-binding protein, excisionase family [Sphingomonas paucimobilis]